MAEPFRCCTATLDSGATCSTIFRPPVPEEFNCPRCRGIEAKYRPVKQYDNESMLRRMDGGKGPENGEPRRPNHLFGKAPK